MDALTQPNREIYNKTMRVRVLLCRKIYYIGKMNKKIYNEEAKVTFANNKEGELSRVTNAPRSLRG